MIVYTRLKVSTVSLANPDQRCYHPLPDRNGVRDWIGRIFKSTKLLARRLYCTAESGVAPHCGIFLMVALSCGWLLFSPALDPAGTWLLHKRSFMVLQINAPPLKTMKQPFFAPFELAYGSLAFTQNNLCANLTSFHNHDLSQSINGQDQPFYLTVNLRPHVPTGRLWPCELYLRPYQMHLFLTLQ